MFFNPGRKVKLLPSILTEEFNMRNEFSSCEGDTENRKVLLPPGLQRSKKKRILYKVRRWPQQELKLGRRSGDHCWGHPLRQRMGGYPGFWAHPPFSLHHCLSLAKFHQSQSEPGIYGSQESVSGIQREEGKGMGNIYYDVYMDRNEAERQNFLMDKIFTKTLNESYFFVSFKTKWGKLCLSR